MNAMRPTNCHALLEYNILLYNNNAWVGVLHIAHELYLYAHDVFIDHFSVNRIVIILNVFKHLSMQSIDQMHLFTVRSVYRV